MKFDIWFDIRGSLKDETGIPNNTNPVECKNLRELLELLSKSLPQPFGCECIGIEIKEHKD